VKTKSLVNWFVINVSPMVHVASWAKNNWQPYADESGAPPLYSIYVILSKRQLLYFSLNITGCHHNQRMPRKQNQRRNQRVNRERKENDDKKDNDDNKDDDNKEDEEKEVH